MSTRWQWFRHLIRPAEVVTSPDPGPPLSGHMRPHDFRRWDPEQHMVIVRTAGEWRQQALDGLDAIERANGGKPPARFIDGSAIDHAAFASVVEALLALEPLTGKRVGQDLLDAAGLVPVDQAILW